MGFLSGRVSYLRYQVDGPSPGIFGPEHLEKLAEHAIGKQPAQDKDGTEAGWIAGEDILDLGFDLAKNVQDNALHFALRLDTKKLPADLLRAYAREELEILSRENPSVRPSGKQKKQARENARERLEQEAQDGRFTRRKAYPLLWDGQTNQVLIGTTSASALDHALRLFQETFGSKLILQDAGFLALNQLSASAQQADHDLRPSSFHPGQERGEIAWVADPSSISYLGNELMLWLWFRLEMEGDSILLPDGSEVALMLTRSLLLDCPRGQSGNETIRSDGPTRLPEARRAIQAGKLPRQAGMILVRHESQYELTLQAETLAVNSAKLPAVEESDERAKRDERIGQMRHLIETLDLLFGAFLKVRLGTDWLGEKERMQRWLQREDRERLAASA